MFRAITRNAKKPLWYLVHGLTGKSLATETHYLDWSIAGASYLAPIDPIKRMLPSTKLTPVQIRPGMTSVQFYALECRKVRELLPYNEFSIQVPVRYQADPADPGILASIHLFLPVSSEEARWGGVEIYGMPKFLAEIDIQDTADSRVCTLQADRREILSLKVGRIATSARSQDWHYFGVVGNRLVRTLFHVEGPFGTRDQDLTAVLKLGDHPVAEDLRALDLQPLPTVEEYGEHLTALLHKPLGTLPL